MALFPAATTIKTPLVAAASTAEFNDGEYSPPRDKLAMDIRPVEAASVITLASCFRDMIIIHYANTIPINSRDDVRVRPSTESV